MRLVVAGWVILEWNEEEVLGPHMVSVGHGTGPVLAFWVCQLKMSAESLQLWKIPSSDSPRIVLLKANVESASFTPE